MINNDKTTDQIDREVEHHIKMKRIKTTWEEMQNTKEVREWERDTAKLYGFDSAEYKVSADEVKKIPIKLILEMYNIEPNKGFIKCISHADKTASMKIYFDTNSFYCFGCGVGGSVIDFVMQSENCSFSKAMSVLQDYA